MKIIVLKHQKSNQSNHIVVPSAPCHGRKLNLQTLETIYTNTIGR